MRFARIALYFVLGLVAVLAICTVVILNLDFGRFQEYFEETVTEVLNREFVIEGDLVVEIDVRRIRVVVSEARLAGSNWGAAPELGRIGRLDASVDTRSLFDWPIRIESLDVEGVHIDLEENDAGQVNWELFDHGEELDTEEDLEPPTELPVILESARISDVALTYGSPGRPQPLSLTATRLTVERNDDDHLDVYMDGELNDTVVVLNARVGEVADLVNYRDVTVDVVGNLGEIELNGNATIDSLLQPKRPTMQFSVSGPNAEYLTDKLGVQQITSGPLDLTATIAPLANDMQLNLNGSFGEFTLDVSGQFQSLRASDNLSLRIAASGPDAGKIARLFGNPDIPPEPFNVAGKLTRAGPDLDVDKFTVNVGKTQFVAEAHFDNFPRPEGANATLRISGPDFGSFNRLLGLPGQLTGPFNMDIDLAPQADGSATVRLSANAKDLQFTIAGTVANTQDLSGSNIRVDVSGPELRTITDALGIADAPSRRFEAGVDLERVVNGVAFTNGSIVIGDDLEYELTAAGIVTNAPNLVGTRAQIRARGDSLGALTDTVGIDEMPDLPFHIEASLERVKDGIAVENGRIRLGQDRVAVIGLIGEKPFESDTRLRFDAESMDLEKTLASFGIEVDALPPGKFVAGGEIFSRGGRFQLRGVNASLAGLHSSISGELGAMPSFGGTDVRVEVKGDDLAVLLPENNRLAGLYKPFRLSGRVQVGKDMLKVTGAKIGIPGFDAAATLDIGLSPIMSRGRFEVVANSPDLVPLMPEDYHVLQTGKVPLRLRTRGRWDEKRWTLEELELGLVNGALVGGGTVGAPPEFRDTDLTLDLNIASLSTLSLLAGRELPDDPAQLAFHLVESSGVVRLEKFDGHFGDSDIAGRLALHPGDVPEIEVDFTSTRLNLEPYLGNRTDMDRAVEKAPASEKKPERLIPDIPIPMEKLENFSANVDIDIKQIDLGAKQYTDVVLVGAISDGGLAVEQFSVGNSAGGYLRGDLALHPVGDEAELSLEFTGSKMILGMPAVSAEELAGVPRYDMETVLVGRGSTVRALAASLGGYLRVVGGEGQVRTTGLHFLTGDFLSEVLTAVNPFAKTDPYTKVQCYVLLAQIEDGKAMGRPFMVAQTERLRVIADVDIDLGTERFSANINSVPQKGLGLSVSHLINPYVKLSGTFTKPALTLDPEGAIVEGGAAIATGGISILLTRFKERFIDDKDACGKALEEAQPGIIELRKRYRPDNISR